METAYLKSHRANVVIVETETLLDSTNHYVICEDGPHAGAMVYINERELKR